MLAADKLQLQSALKQQATALKEKEFTLHHTNFSEFSSFFGKNNCNILKPFSPCFSWFVTVTVGTQAAVLAGLDITMFVEFNPPHNDDWVRSFA
jgi:hypothetical protein